MRIMWYYFEKCFFPPDLRGFSGKKSEIFDSWKVKNYDEQSVFFEKKAFSSS